MFLTCGLQALGWGLGFFGLLTSRICGLSSRTLLWLAAGSRLSAGFLLPLLRWLVGELSHCLGELSQPLLPWRCGLPQDIIFGPASVPPPDPWLPEP